MNISTAGPEGLRYLEDLMFEIGAHSATSTALSSPHVTASSPTPSSKGPSQRPNVSHIRDCLEQNSRAANNTTNQAKSDMSSIRRSPSPSSMIKGAILMGKNENEEIRYFGKGFAARSESPGPIYDPPTSAFNAAGGLSFSKAPKRTMETRSMDSEGGGSELIMIPGSVGKQVLSSFSSASSAAFSRGSRFNNKMYISRVHNDNRGLDSPSPTAYQPSNGSTNEGHGALLCGGRVSTAKLFISRAHTADCIGMDSPGPIYHVADSSHMKGKNGLMPPFYSAQSTLASGPSVGFTGSRSHSAMDATEIVEVTNPKCRCHIEKDETTGKSVRHCVHETSKPGGISKAIPTEPFISHAHSKVQSTANTPGPAYYDITESQQLLDTSAHVSFTKAKLEDKNRYRTLSPGPKYTPSYKATEKNVSGVTFGSKLPHEDRSDRFSDKMFLGKGLVTGEGMHSPGPIYDPKNQHEAPQVTMTFKERVFDKKKLFPGPSRSRFVSAELAKENLGTFSPGPKYDVRGVTGSEVPSYSIPQASKDGSTAAKKDNADDDMDGKAKKKKKTKPVLLYPKDDYLSNKYHGPAVAISPVPSTVSKKRSGSEESEDESKRKGSPTELKETSFHLVEKAYPAVQFSKNSRLPPTRVPVQPGPTQYTPNWTHVEPRVAGVAIGIM